MELVSIFTLAKLWEVSIPTLRRLVKSGKIPHHRIGKLVRFHLPTLERWLQDKEAKPVQRKETYLYEPKIQKPRLA